MGPPTQEVRITTPRLLATPQEVEDLRARVARGGIRERVERLRQECAGYVDGDPEAEWAASEARGGWSWQLEATRGSVRRMFALGLGWLLLEDARFARRARRELEWLAARPRWIGRDHDRPGERGYALETGETCLAVALGLDWLRGQSTADEERDARHALRERGILPYLRATADGDEPARWYRKTNNWNPVCNGGAIVGALALDDELTERTIRVARDGLETFLSALPPDGGYHESTSYWTYAFAYLCYAGAALRSARADDLGILDRPAVAMAPRYYIAFVPGGAPSGFGDMSVGRRAWRAHSLYLIARLHDRPEYAWYQDRFGDFHPIELLWRDHDEDARPPRDRLWAFPSTHWAATTSDPADPAQRYLAIKGGDLSAAHSHRDAASIVIRAHERVLVAELGAGRYSAGYFAGRDRDLFHSTASHSTLVIDGRGQRQDGRATLRSEERGGEALVEVDASGCYDAPLERFRRRVLFVGASYWVVFDEVGCAREAEMALLLQTLGTVRVLGPGRAEIRSGDVVLDVLWDASRADAQVRSAALEGGAELPDGTRVGTLDRRTRATQLDLVTVLAPRRADEARAEAAFTGGEVFVRAAGRADLVRYEPSTAGRRSASSFTVIPAPPTTPRENKERRDPS